MMANNIIYFSEYLESNNPVTLNAVNNYSLTHYDGTPRQPDGRSVSQLPAGSWLRFTTALPTGPFSACMLFTSTQIAGQHIEIHIGSMDNAPSWNITVTPSGVENAFVDTNSAKLNNELSDPVDIYFYFPAGFDGHLNWFVFHHYSGTETQEDKLRRMQWFSGDRFGHMMHWGAYSVLGRGEWVMDTEDIPKADYIQQACIPFNPTNWDPESWADVIQRAGQRYLTITTKHHDGFAMFSTNALDFAPYDVENTASLHANVLIPLAAACRARGIRFCCYYSLLDWGNEYEAAIEDADDQETAPNPADVTRYLSQMKEHLKELVELFDPAIIWFDGAWAAFNTEDVSLAIKNFLHRLSPDIVINDRIGNGEGDYATPEQSIPADAQAGPWEACMTINKSWGYNSSDTHWKSTRDLLNNLIDCASKGGNYLLNTGPDSNGIIPQPCVDRLSDIGQWLEKWGEAIYNTRAGTLDVSAQPGVWCTLSADHKLYVIITAAPADGRLRIDMPLTLPRAVWWLDQPDTAVSYDIEQGYLVVDVPQTLPDPLGIVLVAQFDRLPEAKPLPDLALFGRAEADNVWNNDVAEYSPQRVLDGNAQTRWATDRTSDVHLTVHLLRAVTFDRIGFTQYQQRIDAFTLEVFSGADSVWQMSGKNPAINFLMPLPAPVNGDKIVLSVLSCHDSDKPASLYAFSLYDSATTLLPVNQPVNLAKGALAVASDVWYDDREDYSALNVTDGDMTTRWATNGAPTLPITLTITFLQKEVFDRIQVTEFLTSGQVSRTEAFTLQVLNEDGISWRDIFQGSHLNDPIILDYLTEGRAIRFVITAITSGPSVYDVTVYQTVREAINLSEAELLDAEARQCFAFLWRESNLTRGSKGYGLVADTSGSRRASIANTGFALSGLVIAVERGWVDRERAEQRCRQSLETLLNYAPQRYGFFQHFIDMDDVGDVVSEVSTVDTMLALNGILTAGQYFGAECGQLAQQIFDRVNWVAAIAPNGHFTMGWSPEGEMMSATWGGYAEQFCLYPMAAGSNTFPPPDAAAMFYHLERKYGHYGDSGDLVYVWGGALFTYQFSHAWLDFRRLWDRQGTDWWQNSINASAANRNFCIANHDVLPSLDANNWGITACNGPAGYYPYGAPPSGNIGENNQHYTDGTVTPSGPLGSLPFMPREVLDAMTLWYENPRLWTSYGFVEAFNLSGAAPWYCPFNSGLIKGLTLLMIENYRSGLIWDMYMRHPVIARGVAAIFDAQAPEILYQERAPGVTCHGGGWWLSQDRPLSLDGNSMVTQNDGDYVEFTFNGRNAALYGERNVDQGDIDFYLDGVLHGSASAYSAQHLASDIIYAVTDLAPDQHVLKCVKRNGRWMTVDAFKVYASNSFDAAIQRLTPGQLILSFTQSADRLSASDPASYTLAPDGVIEAATLSEDKTSITLTLSSLREGQEYVLTTNGVANEINSERLDKRTLIFNHSLGSAKREC
ncbi:alpha-L-fucosidase [Siccibacter colletis]|uniref:alpha-L-fucosidase n=1 Tax=Siccibacter colletis TaxID=1505757 RepID=UPI0028BDA861|nr:alpha-L-fucosidase [Siccibacter colletis]WNN50152.1 alpha-L-fucosidase [Siccibacter colletis]